MKKIILLLGLFMLNCVNVFAVENLTVREYLDSAENKKLKIQDRVNSYKAAAANIQQEIKRLDDLNGYGGFMYESEINNNIPEYGCQKITNKMWLRSSRMNDSQVNGDVTKLQKFFKKIGIVNWDGDGEFGTWDRAAVWKFQQQYMPEISPTGDVGVKTMAKVNSMICGELSANAQYKDKNFSFELTSTNKKDPVSLYPITKVVLKISNVSAVGLVPESETVFEIDNSCKIQNNVTGENGGIAPWLFCNGKHEFEKYAVFYEGGNYVIKHAVESGKDGSMPYLFFKQITFYN